MSLKTRMLKKGLLALLFVFLMIALGVIAGRAQAGRASLMAGGTATADLPQRMASEPLESGPSQKATEIGRVFGFPITNSMLVTWIVALVLITFAQVTTRNMQPVPSGAQNFLDGKHDDVPAGNFYMKGGIEEIIISVQPLCSLCLCGG